MFMVSYNHQAQTKKLLQHLNTLEGKIKGLEDGTAVKSAKK